VDATGLETHHVSGYFARRVRRVDSPQPAWPKLTVVGHVSSHLIVAAIPGQGPSNDSPCFGPAVRQACGHVRFRRLLADAAYDAEHNHQICKDLGAQAVIQLNRRWFGRKWPVSPLRRRLHRKFPRRVYGRRSHAESIFSTFKRTLGSALRARGQDAQARELLWKVLAYDLMILRRLWRPFNGASLTPLGRPRTPRR
jgi:hypothetical protein